MKKIITVLFTALLLAGCNGYEKSYNEAAALFNSGDYETAKVAFEELIESDPTKALGYSGVISCAFQSGDYDSVITTATTAIENGIEDSDIYNLKAKAELALGKTEDAQADLEKSLELNPENKDSIVELYDLYVAKGDVTSAYNLVHE